MLTTSDLEKIHEIIRLEKQDLVTKSEFNDFKLEMLKIKDMFTGLYNYIQKDSRITNFQIEGHSIKLENLEERVTKLEEKQ